MQTRRQGNYVLIDTELGRSDGRPRPPAQLRPRRRPAAAMKTFWKFGYEGASMAALTEAMGINSPSLYAAFGSKEQLFREADRPLSRDRGQQDARHLGTSTHRARRDRGHAAQQRRQPDQRRRLPHGCLLILGDSNASPENDGVRQYLCQRRRDIQAALEERLKRGIADGDIPAACRHQGDGGVLHDRAAGPVAARPRRRLARGDAAGRRMPRWPPGIAGGEAGAAAEAVQRGKAVRREARIGNSLARRTKCACDPNMA